MQDKLTHAIKWREQVEDKTLVEVSGYSFDYMGYDTISQDELDEICQRANNKWIDEDSSLRVYNSMGEIRPAKKSQRELPF